MAKFAPVRTALLAGVASLTLAACGADDIASPGEGGVIVLPSPTPAPTPTPTTPSPTPGAPAASCPTGTTDVGTIAVSASDTRRNCQISGTITGGLRLQNLAGTIYSLNGRVQVGQDLGADPAAPLAGATAGVLTLDAGVVIFGGSGADFLLVNRGSQLNVDGSATRPVIMTSRNNVIGTSTADSIGEWGGLVLLGRGPIADCADGTATGGTVGCVAPVEGTSGAIYGGASPNESTGTIRFLQVRHSGFRVDTNNELNGITLAGVGGGTIFENVQVHNSSDDGFEWFGGRVNGRNIVATGNDDDSLDVDSGFKGSLQDIIVTQRAGGGDHIVEADSNGNDARLPRTDVRFANFTFVGSTARNTTLLLRGGGDYSFLNGVMTGSPRCIDIDGASTAQAANAAQDEDGPPVFQSVFMSCAASYTEDTDVNAAAIATIFTAGTNNTALGTSTLANVFVNGTNENGVTPFAAATNSPFFVNRAFIGAVRDASTTWWQGWTCGLPAQAACTAIPAAG
jgi:hypothetical protein